MRRLIQIAVLILLFLSCWLVAEGIIATREASRTLVVTRETVTALPAMLDERAADVASIVDSRAASIEGAAVGRLASVERTLDARLASLEARLDSRVGEAVSVADRRLGEATASLSGVSGGIVRTLASVDALARRSDAVVGDIHAQIYPWIDCGSGVMGEGKPCIQGEVWWMSKKVNTTLSSVTLASETMSDTLRAYGPSTARSVDGIASSLDKMGKWYTSKKRVLLESGLILSGALLRGGR